jgi:aspergillopepsin I
LLGSTSLNNVSVWLLLDKAAYYGDGTSSGLLGLGRNAGTSLYKGNTPSATSDSDSDSWSDRIQYSSVINSIFSNNLTPSVFALALSRDDSATGFGGYLTIGDVPDISDPYVNASSQYATVPFLSDPETDTISGYSIQYDGLSWSGGSSSLMERTIVDSGTIFIYVPSSAAEAVNSLFDPPATLTDEGLYQVDCKATAPEGFAVIIGGMSFPINVQDMGWYSTYNGFCYSAVQDSKLVGEANILGDPFLRSVLAVYDWGNEQMHIASRTYYES